MIKTIAFLLAGAIPAGLITYFFAADAEQKSAVPDPYSIAERNAVDSKGVADLREVAAIDDADELERRLRLALVAPYSPTSAAEITALYKGIAALDLDRALSLADEALLEPGLVADVIQALAEQNFDAGLAALAALPNARHRRETAVALFVALGSRPPELERIAAVLPVREQIDFQAEALAALAESDPNSALSAALGLREIEARNTAVQRVGTAWVARDPLGAIRLTETLPPELQAEYRNSVSIAWARQDVAAFLAYADSQPRLDELVAALTHAMGVDPALTFAVASRHPPVMMGGPLAVTVERVAFGSMAELDPAGTLAELNAMPAGARKEEFLTAFAETYARMAPQEALAWAQGLEPPNPVLVSSVIARTSLVDMDLALRWLIEVEPEPSGPFVLGGGAPYNIGTFFGADPKRVDLANRLLAMPEEPNATATLRRLLQVWSLTDPGSAVDWMLSSDGAANPDLAGNIARALATRNAEAAAGLLDRMPPELRSAWIRDVAAPFAAQNPTAAADWIAQFAGEAGYEQVLARVVQQTANSDPVGSSRLLPTLPEQVRQPVVQVIANSWAQQDLAAAANWAIGLDNEREQAMAVSQVGGAWANRDPAAAQRWAAGLPRGATRDQALVGVFSRLGRDAYVSTIDWQLLSAFESDAARGQAVRQVVSMVGSRDPAEARSLIDRWITDPSMREQAEQALQQAGG